MTGYFDGDHAVKLIGWDEHKNWLLINSFGLFWGDNGTFLISQNYEESYCDFGYAIVAPQIKEVKYLSSNAISFRFHNRLYVIFNMLNIFLKFDFY